MIRTGAIVLALVCITHLLCPASAQTLTVGPNVDINRQTGYQAEEAITINRANPSQVFAWSNDLNARNSAAFSTNGGLTWTSRFTGSDGWPALGGDPTCTSDNWGNIYAATFTSNFSSILVGRSTNGGQTFSVINTISDGGLDQPTITASTIGQNSVWITYRNSGGLVTRAATSTGLGTTGPFGAALTIPGTASANFGDIAIGPDGRAAVTYQTPSSGSGPSTIFVNSISGIGGSWSAQGAAVPTNVGGFRSIPAQPSRTVDAEVSLGYDNSTGPRRGTLYMAYTDAPSVSSNDLNIFVRSSTNDGATWSAPVRVNNDTGVNSQFFCKLVVDSVTGNIGVVWYDARNDPANQRVEVWGTVSTDGGLTFLPNVKISTGSTRGIGLGGGNELGDYLGLDFYNNIMLPCWADDSNSTGDNPDGTSNLDYYTAQVLFSAAIPEPTTIALMGVAAAGGLGWLVRRHRMLNKLAEQPIERVRR
jgi:hypothetical protein